MSNALKLGIVTAMAAALLLLVMYQAFSSKPLAATNATTTAGVLIEQESYATSTITASTTEYVIDAPYPVFARASAAFNDAIKSFVEKAVADFKTQATENQAARRDAGEKDLQQYEFATQFDVVQSNENAVSVVLHAGGFAGAAHGYDVIQTFNFDVAGQKTLTLSDVVAKPRALEIISNLTRSKLAIQLKAAQFEGSELSGHEIDEQMKATVIPWIEEGTTPEAQNFPFTFTPTGMTIYFSAYQVAPYVMGEPEVEISKEEWQSAAI